MIVLLLFQAINTILLPGFKVFRLFFAPPVFWSLQYRIFVLMTWETAIERFRTYMLLERSFSTNTIDAYLRDVGKLKEFVHLKEKGLSPVEVHTACLQSFFQWLYELALSARTQARIRSALRTFYRYLMLEDLIDQDPTELLEAPRLARNIPEILSPESIQAILEAIDLTTDHGVRNRAIMETLYACGLRVSELTDLRLTNIFRDVGFIRVLGKGNKERIVPIGPEALKHIDLYIEGVRRRMLRIDPKHENILFLNRRGRKLSRVSVFTAVKEAASRAGISQKVSPHTFRHSFATHLVEGGADLKAVQDMLGHESIITTEIYTHLDADYLRETILAFHPRHQKTPPDNT